MSAQHVEVTEGNTLMRCDTIPREAPYYCYEFLLHDNKNSFDFFLKSTFPKISKLFALGLSRTLFYRNASKQPLDLKTDIIEKRFWWDFSYDKVSNHGSSFLSYGSEGEKRLGIYKMKTHTLPTGINCVVPGLKGLAHNGIERLVLIISQNDCNDSMIDYEQLEEKLEKVGRSSKKVVGHIIYSRIQDTISPVYSGFVAEVLFEKNGMIGIGQKLMQLKSELEGMNCTFQWGIYMEESFLPIEYNINMRYPSIIGRIHGF